MRARHALAFVGDTVGLLLLLFLRLLPCRPCLSSELTGRVARIGPCFDVEHGEDFRIRCDPDILSYRQVALGPLMLVRLVHCFKYVVLRTGRRGHRSGHEASEHPRLCRAHAATAAVVPTAAKTDFRIVYNICLLGGGRDLINDNGSNDDNGATNSPATTTRTLVAAARRQCPTRLVICNVLLLPRHARHVIVRPGWSLVQR